MRRTIKAAVVVATIAGGATIIQQVAEANLLPQSGLDNALRQSQSAGAVPGTSPAQLNIDASSAAADAQQSTAVAFSGLQPAGAVAFADLQQQIAFSYSPAQWDTSLVAPSNNVNAAGSLAELPHLASLEQPQQLAPLEQPQTREAATAARNPVPQPKRYASLEVPRDTDQSQRRQRGLLISRIEFDMPALAPVSHTIFCLKYRDDCKVDETVSVESRVTLTSERWAELDRVNTAVNRAIIPQPNTKGLAGEVWLISPRAGECHDYAVTKRHELLALGWPEQDLLLSEVVTSWGEHHLVLVIRTSDGDFVADNLTPNIRIWSQAPYQWVRIQSPGNPLIWSTLANATVASRTRPRVSGQADPS